MIGACSWHDRRQPVVPRRLTDHIHQLYVCVCVCVYVDREHEEYVCTYVFDCVGRIEYQRESGRGGGPDYILEMRTHLFVILVLCLSLVHPWVLACLMCSMPTGTSPFSEPTPTTLGWSFPFSSAGILKSPPPPTPP